MAQKKKYILLSIIGIIVFLGLIGIIFLNQPLRPELILEEIDDKVSIDSSFKIKFDWPVSKKVNISFKPEVLGEISYENNIFNDHLSRTLIFKPEYNWAAETSYEVTISEVRGALPNFLSSRKHAFSFTTESLPKIKSISPNQKEEIRADSQFKITLDKTNEKLAEYTFRIKPNVKIKTIYNKEEKTYTVTPANLLSQGQAYTLEVNKKNTRYLYGQDEIGFQSEPEEVFKGKWQVREAPYIESFVPSGTNVPLNNPIALVFNEEVEFDSFAQKVSIKPALAGAWQTEDNKTFTFTPEDMAKETNYTITIASKLKTKKGGYLEENSTHSFTSIGPVKLLSSSPASGDTGINISSSVKIDLNQPVDRESAQEHFSISPEIPGDFAWDDGSLIFEPASAFDFNTTYTVNLSKGIKGLAGLDSENDLIFNFSTELSVTKLSVAFHHQDHSLSCEVATLVMALSYRGVNISEQQLIDIIGFDPTPKGGGVWGNPHIAFVGDIDGRQPSTGYGVYWQPIAKAGNNFRSTRWFTEGTLESLMNEIKAGNPVIIWGTAGSGSRIDWKTSSGGNVVAINGEHTMLVIGYIGSSTNPSKIIVLDPLYGEKHMTQSSFRWNWGLLGRSGVVVD